MQSERSTGQSGINAFIYFHDDEPYPAIDWNKPDVQLVAEQHPGRFQDEERDVKTPGNEVLSYLDVVTSDSTDSATLRRVIHEFLDKEISFETPPRALREGVALRFDALLGLAASSPEKYREEYRALEERIIKILEAHRGGKT